MSKIYPMYGATNRIMNHNNNSHSNNSKYSNGIRITNNCCLNYCKSSCCIGDHLLHFKSNIDVQNIALVKEFIFKLTLN